MLFTNINLWLLLSKHVSRVLLIRLHMLEYTKASDFNGTRHQDLFPEQFSLSSSSFCIVWDLRG